MLKVRQQVPPPLFSNAKQNLFHPFFLFSSSSSSSSLTLWDVMASNTICSDCAGDYFLEPEPPITTATTTATQNVIRREDVEKLLYLLVDMFDEDNNPLPQEQSTFVTTTGATTTTNIPPSQGLQTRSRVLKSTSSAMEMIQCGPQCRLPKDKEEKHKRARAFTELDVLESEEKEQTTQHKRKKRRRVCTEDYGGDTMPSSCNTNNNGSVSQSKPPVDDTCCNKSKKSKSKKTKKPRRSSKDCGGGGGNGGNGGNGDGDDDDDDNNNNKSKRHRWTPEEDVALSSIVQMQEEGERHWCKIAKDLKEEHNISVTGKQCHARYQQFLDPNVYYGPWSEEEDVAIVRFQAFFDNKVCDIFVLSCRVFCFL